MIKPFTYTLLLALFVFVGSARAGELDRGMEALFGHRDYQSAKQLLQPLADQGNALAQYEIGAMYERGWGSEQDLEEALKWLQKSADQGFSPAQDLIADIYDRGLGVPADHAKAKEWRDKSKASEKSSATIDHRWIVRPPHYREMLPRYRPFPPEGVIPDEATAIQVAETILKTRHGEATVKSQEPYSAFLKGDVWTVRGHMLPPGWIGVVFEVEISKSRGCILGIDEEN
ncbi:MAG: hypothetical protein LAO55_18350 [Acidobacteriia bacterium]|nr:hypothetical protein [Terriglobia bacterium]